MSEHLLKAIIQLFAIVAKEDEVTHQEREQIRKFLHDHLSNSSVPGYLDFFDQYTTEALQKGTDQKVKEEDEIERICSKINLEFTQNQKIVVILELLNIILADELVSKREEELLKIIATAINIEEDEVEIIKSYVSSHNPENLDDPHILIVDSGKNNKNTKSKHIVREGIDGFGAVLHLEKAELFVIKYRGASEVYLNGAALQPGIMVIFSVGSTIRFSKGSPIYYSDVVSQFMVSDSRIPLSFKAESISFKFKNGNIGLRNITIKENGGGLIGLMGASGAGKSTLLHVLNGSETPYEGAVEINGINIHKYPEKIDGVLGFVPQDDLLIEELTVYENLYFASRLCFKNATDAELDTLVTKTLKNLGLLETKQLKVGSPLQKTISGGQRKRLNIGLELLREPAVLYVDEPTSGLSSRDSENIMDLLKELSLKGKLIFVVIHQPSSDIFKMFDKLVILDVGGYQIYYGNPLEAVVYFKNMANLINQDHGACEACGNVNPEQIFNIIETRVVNENGRFTDERKVNPEEWNQLFTKHTTLPKITEAKDPPPANLHIPNRLNQWKIFSLRDIKSKISNQQYVLINVLEAPFLAAILAFIVRYYDTENMLHQGYIFGKNVNIPAYFFMSVIVALFMGLTVSAEEIIRDQKILKREALLNLSRGSYLASKIGILFTISAFQTLTFVLIGSWILEVPGMILSHWMILFSTACFANLLGLNISSAFNSAVTIYILIPILLIPQLLLSGVVVKFDKLNPTISSEHMVPLVGDLMASRWAFEASMVTQFKDNDFEKQFYQFDKAMAEADYKRIYYLPTLESKLQFCINNLHKPSGETQEAMADNLNILQKEIKKELDRVNQIKFPELERLKIETFDSTLFLSTNTLLDDLKRYYRNRYNNADRIKDELVESLTNTPDKLASFEAFRLSHQNENITSIVKNQNEAKRIIEKDGRLIQKIFPIYMEPVPDHPLDFMEQFYVPAKSFLGYRFDTLHFNILAIWLMTTILMLLLYYDVFRYLVKALGRIGQK